MEEERSIFGPESRMRDVRRSQPHCGDAPSSRLVSNPNLWPRHPRLFMRCLLIKTVQAGGDFATSLVVRLLYGCGLRVTEPLNLRIKDVKLDSMQLVIRAAK